MICNNWNRTNDTTENQNEKKTCFNAYAGGVKRDCPSYSKQANKMWLKSLSMLKCDSRTGLYAVQ